MPPDPNLAVGLDDVIVTVNTQFIVYDKLGYDQLGYDQLGEPRIIDLHDWFSNVVPDTAFMGDPKVLYDSGSHRFVMIAIACNSRCDQPGANQSWWLVSASQTASALGLWWNWALDARLNGNTLTNNWADYPGLGVDNLAVYLTANMFDFDDNDFEYAKLRILDKSVLYSGGSLGWHDFWDMCNPGGIPSVCFPVPIFGCGGTNSAFTIQPAYTFGRPGTEYLINARGESDTLTLWRLTNPLGGPSLDCRSMETFFYTTAPGAEQGGGGQRIDTGDTRLLNAVYRNGSLWTAHTIAVNWGDGNVAGARWYQIDPSTGSFLQAATYGARGFHYYYPTVVPDSWDNMVMVYSRSSPSEFVSVQFAGRRDIDPIDRLRGSNLLQAGTANYGGNRWGDYFGIAWDPDTYLGDILWIHGEYAGASGPNTWGTWVGAVTFAW
jgi:hypothetical protein